MLNNENAFKCTATGYYETVQCDDSGCFCVDARNGAAAEGTRTNDNKKAPTCSRRPIFNTCSKSLQNVITI